MKNLNVLLLEDNALDAELNQTELRDNLTEYTCTFYWVTNKPAYRRTLDTLAPDLVLSDYTVASYSGLEALRDLRTKYPYTPFIFVTGAQQEEVAAQAIKEGAWDYVVKDRISRLTMAVQNALRLREEQQKNSEIREAVTKSELRFRTLFNSASDAIFMMQGPTFIDCNAATEKIFGCSKEQIVGESPVRFSPPFQPSGVASEIAAHERIAAALSGTSQFFEWQHIQYDGTLFDAEVSLNRLEIGGDVFIQAIVRDVTQRKKSEAENFRLAMVANSTNNIVVIADAEGKIEWVNRAFTTITEYSFEEVIGKRPGSFLQGPDTDKKLAEFMSKQLAQGLGFKDLEIINYTKSGKPYWILIEVQPIRDESGKLRQFIAIESDTTERKKTQLVLADREKRFRNLVQQSPVAVIEWDTRLNVLEWNEAAEKIFGYTRAEAMGRCAFGLILPSAPHPQVEKVLDMLIAQQGGNRNTNKNIKKDGKSILCEWYNRPLTDEVGKTIGIVSMVEDITEKVKAEKELKESELKFRQIINSSPMGIYLYEVNANNQLILVGTNPAADTLTGIRNADFIGKTLEEIFPGLKETDVPGHYLEAALHGTPWFTEDMRYHEGKVSGAFQIYAFQAGHNRVGVMFLNITEQKKIEAAIKQKNEELLKINAELDSFVYSASHDLRAPIASLLGLVEVARLEKDVSSLDRLLDMQKRSLLKLDNFIHDIVSYSRNNRLDVQVEPIDFITLIEGIFEQLYFMDHLGQLDCRIIITPQLNFFSDSKRIAVILNNLISNAIKYADINKPNPFVEVRVDKSPDGVIISVEDNGDGIEAEHLPKIFDMFYRATQKSSGSGIGLYIVHEITNKMKGSIKVESVRKAGSKFIVNLPNLYGELMSPLPLEKKAQNQAKQVYTEVEISTDADSGLFENFINQLVSEYHAKLLNHIHGVDTDYADFLLQDEKLTLHRQTFTGISMFPTELGNANPQANELARQVGSQLKK